MSHCTYCNAVLTSGSAHCEHCGAVAGVRKGPPVIAPSLEAELRQLLAAGRKIEAIKQLREATRAGLAEAKEAVERMEYGAEFPRVQDERSSQLELAFELEDLLRAGRKIEAIKLYRERTGAGLKEAKDAVEALGILPEAGSRGGCLGVLALLLVVGAAMTAAL
jgi:ribosomal protein L7/L12